MKKKILCLVLTFAVVFSFMPFFTLQADAFSTGSVTLKSFKTVTIQPGKTYKIPVVKLSKKRTFQVPITIKVSNKSKKKQVTKGGFTLYMKNSKGKVIGKYNTSLKYVGIHDEMSYVDWIYFYNKSISKPCFAKGKYYFSIKNTSNCTLRVKYAVKGYTKFASNAEFIESKTVDYNAETNDFVYLDSVFPYIYLGRIGPGLPAISSVKSSNPDTYVDSWILTHDGKLYIYIDSIVEEADTVVSVKLKNKKDPYNINIKVKNYAIDEGLDD